MSSSEKEQLISHSPKPSDNTQSVHRISQSDSSSFQEQPAPSTNFGFFSRTSKQAQYSRVNQREMTDETSVNASSHTHTQSHQQILSPKLDPNELAASRSQPNSPRINDDDDDADEPESPSIESLGPNGSSSLQSKDDLDLHSFHNRKTAASLSQPRASAVNPISIPLQSAQKLIRLDTAFDVIPLYHNKNRSLSQGDKSPASSPNGQRKEKEVQTFTHNIVVYENNDNIENEEKKSQKIPDMTRIKDDENMTTKEKEKDLITINISDPKNNHSPLTKTESKSKDTPLNDTVMNDNNNNNNKEIKIKNRVSVKDVFDFNKSSKKDEKSKHKKTKNKLKKDKSVFDAFKIKEKKPDLSNIKNLPMSLKTNLKDDSNDHATSLILDHIRDLDDVKKAYIYEQLANDKEFIPRICNKLLEATDAKHNEIVCILLYDFFSENNNFARLFAVQFIPCLIWCLLTRSQKCVSGIVAALLSLYKKETNIFENCIKTDEFKNALNENKYGVSNHHKIFPKFEMPDLDLPSIYHEPNSSQFAKNNNSSQQLHSHTSSQQQQQQQNILLNKNKNKNKSNKNKLNKNENSLLIRENVFPSLNQANLSTNLHLIYVALQVFNHYITRVPNICLEQMCSVISKLCSSGLDASQPINFPDSITSKFAWDWKWYTDEPKEKQHEKYILPSVIICQFLSSIRYSLKQPKTKNIAKFALAQVHKRGHLDMIPEIILQTTSMLHSAFINGLTF